MIIKLRLTPYQVGVLKSVLEEEIDRNSSEYPDINKACEAILKQI